MIDLEFRVFNRVVLPLSYALQGRRSLQFLAELQSNEKISPEAVLALQLRKLKRLIAHAYENVPFYRRRFAENQIEPGDIRSLDDYARVPVLTKRDLIANLEQIVASNFDRDSLQLSSTGGSTGTLTNYYHDQRYAHDVQAAGTWRAWSWAGVRPGDRHLYIWGAPREIADAQTLRWRVKHFVLRRMFVDAFDLSEAKLAGMVRQAQRFRPRLVYGYASSVTAFAQYVRATGPSPPSVRSVMTTAERLLPEQRAILRDAFGCPVFDQYGCREVLSIASECPAGKLHINADLNVVEFVAPDSANPDQRWIVLTPLELFGFPLLRYVNEDFGDAGSPCACRLPFPTMELQVGRISDNFTLPSGRLVHGEYFTHLVYGLNGVRRFQFQQVAPNRVLFRVVWDRTPGSADTLAQIRRLIAEAEGHLGEGCRIELQEVEDIPLTASGKYRFTVSDVTPSWSSPSRHGQA